MGKQAVLGDRPFKHDEYIALARTRSPDYDNIQEMILGKTAQLFASRGYVASSIGDIAAACECSKSRLYHYFESKEAILIAMLSGHVERLVEETRELVAQNPDPRARFIAITRNFMEVYAASRATHIVLLTCMEFLPPAKREELVDKQRELVSAIRNILKALESDANRARGRINIDTMLFFGMINWAYTWYRPDGAMKPADLADHVVDMVLNGCAGEPGASAQAAPGIKAGVRH